MGLRAVGMLSITFSPACRLDDRSRGRPRPDQGCWAILFLKAPAATEAAHRRVRRASASWHQSEADIPGRSGGLHTWPERTSCASRTTTGAGAKAAILWRRGPWFACSNFRLKLLRSVEGCVLPAAQRLLCELDEVPSDKAHAKNRLDLAAAERMQGCAPEGRSVV
jgi:hypothetical protein